VSRSAYTVSLPFFEGPLDLLLHLIEKKEVDITKVSLAAVTDDFLATLEAREQIDPEKLVEFLVVAAKLLVIKSSLLLPNVAVEEAEEDEGESLAQTLETYRQFKQVASHLAEREAQGLRSFVRVAPLPPLEPRLDPQGLTLNDLFAALRGVLKEKTAEPENVDEVVRPLRITVRQRITELTAQLRGGQPLAFSDLLSAEPTRQEVIATFLAMLELLKLGWARVRQKALWGRIELVPILEALPEGEGDDRTARVDEYI
jgi:segregation and condensation protein A